MTLTLHPSARSQYDFDPDTEDTDYFANDVTASAGNPFTLAATTTADTLAHKIIITPSGSVTGNYSITGTDADGRTQTETLATDTTNAVTSAKYWASLTSILAPAGIGSETVDIGFVDEFASQTIPLDAESGYPATVSVDHTGTANWTIQTTAQDIRELNLSAPFAFSSQEDLFWFSDGNFTTKSADTNNSLALRGLTAMRFIANSYSAGAEVQMFVTQPK